MIRVVVAEDSPSARELIVAILSADPDLVVVGTACNGREAIAVVEALRPDIVTMDLSMPVMDGVAATREIMARVPTPILIVSVSTTTALEATRGAKALAAGAVYLHRKPAGPAAPTFAAEARELVAMVKAMAQVKVVRRWREPLPPPERRETGRLPGRFGILAVAASTGGPAALEVFLRSLSEALPVPVVIVQHITAGFITGLARWLSEAAKMPVKVAVADEQLVAGTVYLAPDDLHLSVSPSRRIELLRTPAEGGFRPSASALFRAVGRSYGEEALGLVLTGMGADGLAGLSDLRARGGRVVAQDEASCVVYGMPRAAIEAGLVDLVLPLEQIGPHLRNMVRSTTAARNGNGKV